MKHLTSKGLFALLLAVVLVLSAGTLFSLLGGSGDSNNQGDTESKDPKTATNLHSNDTKITTITNHAEEPNDGKTKNLKVNDISADDVKGKPDKTNGTNDDDTTNNDIKSNTGTNHINSNNAKVNDTNDNDNKIGKTTNNDTKPGITKEYETTANVNLREGASTNHEVITVIPQGEKVTYLSTSGTWFEVKYGDQTGFVRSDYLKELSKATTSPTPEGEIKPTYIQGVLIVNKKYPLPANYAPGESWEARQAFNKMADAAKQDGIGLQAFSTYRSYAVQKQLYDRYVARDGQAAADRYSAKPGHSEHQTGLAFDICEEGKYSTYTKKSDATIWLAENAHKYGFILRYPEGKEHITGYMYEHWHYRYLGVDMATKVYNSGLTLEEYLGAY